MSTEDHSKLAVRDEELDPLFHLTVNGWAKKSGLPYTQINQAAKSGLLDGIRMTEGKNAAIYVSAGSFAAWRESLRIPVLVEPKRGSRTDPMYRSV